MGRTIRVDREVYKVIAQLARPGESRSRTLRRILRERNVIKLRPYSIGRAFRKRHGRSPTWGDLPQT